MAATSTPSGKLEDQAATAALYVTRSSTSGPTGNTWLDNQGKLSSAGAATSLKYAKAGDLPSFPSQGGVKLSSAGAAASLAHANQRTFEHWKPGEIPAAGKAAYLAKDTHAPEIWQPEMSAAGSKAATLAARDTPNVNIWHPEETGDGYRAADSAMRKKGLSPHVERGVTAEGGNRALIAATGAMGANRRRSGSSPAATTSFSSFNAAKAATASKGTQRRFESSDEILDSALDHSRIHSVAQSNVDRQLYTANPPVNIEVVEKNRQDTIHASAIAMAKRMYQVQQEASDRAAVDLSRSDSHYAANKVHARKGSVTSMSTMDETPPAPVYTNLQEAAQKLATERLAKLHDEHQAYRNYYGQTSSPRKRLSIRPKVRRRASSDSDAARLDEEQSQKIRSEMSLFQDKLAAVDSKKRQKDRDALMAAAQKNVSARMSTMDEKVFEETGKASPNLLAGWESAAKARAQADSDARMANHGKVHIGSGKYLDQSEVDAIARGRLQPTLDEITEKAEKQRARDEELRLEEEEKKRQLELEKVRSAETKAEQRKARDLEKAEERKQRDLEKSQRAEEKRTQKEAEKAAREENRKSREAEKESSGKKGLLSGMSFGTGAAAAAVGGAGVAAEPPMLDPIPKTEPLPAEVASDQVAGEDEDEGKAEAAAETPPVVHVPSADDKPSTPTREATQDTSPTSPASPSKDESPMSPSKSGVRGWLMGKLGRRSSRAKEEPGLIGGASLKETQDNDSDASPSSPPAAVPEDDSMKEVAMAGRTLAVEPPADDLYASSHYDDDNAAESAAIPKAEGARRSSSPSISSLSSAADEKAEHDEPPSPVHETAAEADTSSPSKGRGRERIAGFLSKGLGRKLSKRQKEKESDKSPEISRPLESTQDDKAAEKSDSGDEQPDFEEARDTFEPGETLAPPPKLTEVISDDGSGRLGKKPSGSPVRDSKFSEEF